MARGAAQVHPRVHVHASVEAPSHVWTREETLKAIKNDFMNRYYVTGRLSLDHYHPRCFFDSPDPDMPVRSPEVFASALKGLFDRRSSSLELLEEPRLVGNDIVAEWRLAGRLGLPWKPSIKPFVGRTTFTLDDHGLVTRHVEEWSLPAWDAFLAALVPSLHLGAAPAPSISELLASRDAGVFIEERWPALVPARWRIVASSFDSLIHRHAIAATVASMAYLGGGPGRRTRDGRASGILSIRGPGAPWGRLGSVLVACTHLGRMRGDFHR